MSSKRFQEHLNKTLFELFKIVLVLAICFWLFVGALVLFGKYVIAPASIPPSDEELATLFKTHRMSFEIMKEMLDNDLKETTSLSVDNLKILRIEPPHRPDTDAVYEKYAEHMKIIGSDLIQAYHEDETIHSYAFAVFRFGLVTGGCSSNIMYRNIGKPTKPSWANPYSMIKIEENWYSETTCN